MERGFCTGITFLGWGVIVIVWPGTYLPSVRFASESEIRSEIQTLHHVRGKEYHAQL